jgi:hypothetical protein
MKTTKWASEDIVNSGRLEKRLLSYGLAAGALLAAGAKTDAAVQTFDFSGSPPTTPTNGHIYFSLQLGTFSTSSTVGMTFDLRQLSNGTAFGATAFGIANGGMIAGLAGSANRFGPNMPIGASRNFGTRGLLAGKASSFSSGNWTPGNGNAFLGLEFLDGSNQVHYGWAELRVNSDFTETLYRIGYETTANTTINTPASIVPEPSELALFAAGAAGLALLRKRSKTGATN